MFTFLKGKAGASTPENLKRSLRKPTLHETPTRSIRAPQINLGSSLTIDYRKHFVSHGRSII